MGSARYLTPVGASSTRVNRSIHRGGARKRRGGASCCGSQPEDQYKVPARTPGMPFLMKNYGVVLKTSTGGRRRVGRRRTQRGGNNEAAGATYLPQRWYNPDIRSSGRGYPVVPRGWAGASCKRSAYGPIVGKSFPDTNLAPFPNATGTQTGGRKRKRKKACPKKKRNCKCPQGGARKRRKSKKRKTTKRKVKRRAKSKTKRKTRKRKR